MKNFKITNHHELRKRVAVKCNSVQKTEQCHKKSCDINAIVANYVKTGVLSHQREKIAQYMDTTQIPSLMEAQHLLRDAKESFLSLPSDIRKLMDNKPENLINFIQNPENHDILVKNGILEEKKVESIPEEKIDPPSASAVDQTTEQK